jgi:hypothetical protein
MKLHYMRFSGGLEQATAALNANRLACFDVVTMKARYAKGSVETTEVVLLVPDDFTEEQWADESGAEFRTILTNMTALYRHGLSVDSLIAAYRDKTSSTP